MTAEDVAETRAIGAKQRAEGDQRDFRRREDV